MSTELNKIFSKYFNPCAHEPQKINMELCKECGGGCCKSMGCHISPFDLKEITLESIISLIDETGCVSIDWWDGNPITNENNDERTYFLRIKNKDSEIIDPTFGGVCSILTDIGCPLAFEYRPKGARELIPCSDECKVQYSKQECAIDWYPFQYIMAQVYNHYFKKGNLSNNPLMTLTAMKDLFDMLLGMDNE